MVDLEEIISRASEAREEEDLIRAERLFSQALRIDSNNQIAVIRLAALHNDRNRPASALPYLKRACEIEPRTAHLLSTLGACYMRLERPVEAADAFRQALTLWPEDPDLHWRYGQALAMMGSADLAIESLRLAADRNPEEWGIHFDLSIALRSAGRLDDADAALRAAIALNSTDAELYTVLAELSAERGDGEAVALAAARAQECAPDNMEILFRVGRALAAAHRREAEGPLRTVIERSPDHPDALLLLGRICQLRGDLSGAEALFSRLLTRHPGHAQTSFHLGEVFEARREWYRAAECFSRSIRLEPNVAIAYFKFANCLRELGQVEDAEPMFVRSGELAHNAVEPLVELGVTRMRLGRWAEAVEAFDAVLKIDPANSSALSNRGFALSRVSQ